MELSLQILILLFAVACLAGYIDTIAGGGGLIVIPTLLAVGIPPAMALATNKLQSTGGSLTASLYFIRRGLISPRAIAPAAAMAFVGSVIGGWAVLQTDPSMLKRLIPILLIAVALIFLLSPSLGETTRPQRLSMAAFAGTAALAMGFYDGFFGPGTGMLLALACVNLLGLNLVSATAHAKVLNFSSNVAALLYFAVQGEIYWAAGLLMLVGQVIGGYLGARTTLRGGQKLIRRLIIAMCLAMSGKLLFGVFS